MLIKENKEAILEFINQSKVLDYLLILFHCLTAFFLSPLDKELSI